MSFSVTVDVSRNTRTVLQLGEGRHWVCVTRCLLAVIKGDYWTLAEVCALLSALVVIHDFIVTGLLPPSHDYCSVLSQQTHTYTACQSTLMNIQDMNVQKSLICCDALLPSRCYASLPVTN